MREIKFRAWDKKAEKMRIVYGVNFHDGNVDCKGVNSRFIDDVVLMQYTGLKDKHGVEIYEGDIVKARYWSGWGKETKIEEVKFVDGEFLPRVTEWISAGDEQGGNVHANPEVLGKQKEEE